MKNVGRRAKVTYLDARSNSYRRKSSKQEPMRVLGLTEMLKKVVRGNPRKKSYVEAGRWLNKA